MFKKIILLVMVLFMISEIPCYSQRKINKKKKQVEIVFDIDRVIDIDDCLIVDGIIEIDSEVFKGQKILIKKCILAIQGYEYVGTYSGSPSWKHGYKLSRNGKMLFWDNRFK